MRTVTRKSAMVLSSLCESESAAKVLDFGADDAQDVCYSLDKRPKETIETARYALSQELIDETRDLFGIEEVFSSSAVTRGQKIETAVASVAAEQDRVLKIHIHEFAGDFE